VVEKCHVCREAVWQLRGRKDAVDVKKPGKYEGSEMSKFEIGSCQRDRFDTRPNTIQ
jgi:hypothetical protein